MPDISLPIDWIPFFGPALETLNLLVWVAIILVPIASVFLFRTPTGLRVRSVGENPRAAATVGISVYWIRYLAVIASGMLAAMGGAFLSIGFVHSFNQSMTAGRGFIALAVVIVGQVAPGRRLWRRRCCSASPRRWRSGCRCSRRARRRCCRRCRTW